MVLTGVATLFLGLIVATILSAIASRYFSLTKFVLYVLGFYFMITTIVGYTLGFLDLPLVSENFFVSYVIILALLIPQAFLRKTAFLDKICLKPDAGDIPSLIVFLAAFTIGILPSLPDMYPVSFSADSATHFDWVFTIYESKSFKHGGWVSNPIKSHPRGMHLNVAVFSMFLGLEPIEVIYPLMVLVYALSGAGICRYVADGVTKDSMLPSLVAGFYLINSIYLHTALTVSGYWHMVFTGFMLLLFLFILREYNKKPDLLKTILLVGIEFAIMMAYVLWSFIPILTVFLLENQRIFMKSDSNRTRVFYSTFFVVSSIIILLYVTSIVDRSYENIEEILHQEGGATPTTLAKRTGVFNILYLALALPGVFLYGRMRDREGVMSSVYASAVIQSIILYFGNLYLKFGRYWFEKTVYLLAYPSAFFAAAFLAFCGDYMLKSWQRSLTVRHIKTLKVLFIVALLASSLCLYNMMLYRGRYNKIITPDQYSTILWVRKNLPPGDMTFFIDAPQSMWFVKLSGHDFKQKYLYPVGTWDDKPSLEFNEFYPKIEANETIVFLDKNKFNFSLIENFTILYGKGDSIVLRKKT